MGLFSKMMKIATREAKKQARKQSKKQVHPSKTSSIKPITKYEPPKYQKPDIYIPDWKDGAERYNCYTVKIKVTDKDTLSAHVLSKEFILEPKEVNGEFHVLSCGEDVGILLDRVDMLRDWIRRGDPYFFCIKNISIDNPEEQSTGMLAFYRDKRKGQEWREQTVVALISYKSTEKQDTIGLIREGAELEFEEDSDHEGSIFITWGTSEIGKLPAKIAKRYLVEDAFGVFFEKTELEESPSGYDYKEKPYVRIFWNKREKDV